MDENGSENEHIYRSSSYTIIHYTSVTFIFAELDNFSRIESYVNQNNNPSIYLLKDISILLLHKSF